MESGLGFLILGGSGFIGARVAQAAYAAGLSAAVTYRTRPGPDGIPAYRVACGGADDGDELVICLSITRPKTVIHCAVSYGFTDENEQLRVSVGTLRALIHGLRVVGLDSRIVYVSTNAVFSGRDGPYREDFPPDPEIRTDQHRFYGLARRAGELLALESWPDVVIARTANVDGRDVWGQINPRLAGQIEPLRAGLPLPRFVDRTISPTLVDNLAEALVEVARPEFTPPPGRIVHLAGCQPTTDYLYAQHLAAQLGTDPRLVREDHFLPAGSAGRYDISLDVGYTQSLIKTRLLGVDEMLRRLFGNGHG